MNASPSSLLPSKVTTISVPRASRDCAVWPVHVRVRGCRWVRVWVWQGHHGAVAALTDCAGQADSRHDSAQRSAAHGPPSAPYRGLRSSMVCSTTTGSSSVGSLKCRGSAWTCGCRTRARAHTGHARHHTPAVSTPAHSSAAQTLLLLLKRCREPSQHTHTHTHAHTHAHALQTLTRTHTARTCTGTYSPSAVRCPAPQVYRCARILGEIAVRLRMSATRNMLRTRAGAHTHKAGRQAVLKWWS
jgi:hypothetical protein